MNWKIDKPLLHSLHAPLLALALSVGVLSLVACSAEDDSSTPPTGTAPDPADGSDEPDEDEQQGSDDPGGPDDDEDSDGSDGCDDGEDCAPVGPASCGPGEQYSPLVNDYEDLGLNVQVRSGRDGRRCRHCDVRNADNVVENNLLSSATMTTPAGTTSSVYITVRMPHVGHGMGFAGFLVSSPEGLHESGVIDRVDVTVVRGNATVDRADPGDETFHLLDTGDGLRHLLLLQTKEGFDSVRIRLKGESERDHTLHVYAACVDRYGW